MFISVAPNEVHTEEFMNSTNWTQLFGRGKKGYKVGGVGKWVWMVAESCPGDPTVLHLLGVLAPAQ